MIRDFLMQLRIELQNDQHAHAHPGETNGKMPAELEPLLQKHGARLLYKIGFGEVTEEQQAEIDRTLAAAPKTARGSRVSSGDGVQGSAHKRGRKAEGR